MSKIDLTIRGVIKLASVPIQNNHVWDGGPQEFPGFLSAWRHFRATKCLHICLSAIRVCSICSKEAVTLTSFFFLMQRKKEAMLTLLPSNMMTTSFWAYSCISVSQAFKSRWDRRGDDKERLICSQNKYHHLKTAFSAVDSNYPPAASIMRTMSHSYPWMLLLLFITKTGAFVAKQIDSISKSDLKETLESQQHQEPSAHSRLASCWTGFRSRK